MGRKRKYPWVQGYWLYSIKIPSNNKYYIGVSKNQCSRRWVKSLYKSKSLAPYLSEWDSMIKTVIKDGLTREEALKMEDDLIQALRFINLCTNEQRSGLIEANDVNTYMKEYYQNNTEYREREKQRAKQRGKQYRKDNREQYNEKQRQYYERNKDKINQQARQRRLKKKLEMQNQQ